MNRTLGRYLLIEPIAAGGMGTIHLAHLVAEGGVHRPVAVKRIKPSLAALEPIRAMFLDEARVLSRLRHPNICSILDFGIEEGVPYLAMEWLGGAPMNLIADRAWHRDFLEPWVVAFLLARAARGLHAAHELEDEDGRPMHVVHRDVSPSNIQVLFSGEVKVIDFGVAFSEGRLSEPTDHGQLKGKYRYMAPEYVRRQQIDRRADIWALGVILWECMSGLPLFDGSTKAVVMKKILRAPIPPLRTHSPEAPEALQAILGRALERDPSRRHATALEFAEELEAYLASLGEPTGAPRLAAWLKEHFEDLIKEEEALLRVARRRAREVSAAGSHLEALSLAGSDPGSEPGSEPGSDPSSDPSSEPGSEREPREESSMTTLAASPRAMEEEKQSQVETRTEGQGSEGEAAEEEESSSRRVLRVDGPILLYAVAATLLAVGLLSQPLWSSGRSASTESSESSSLAGRGGEGASSERSGDESSSGGEQGGMAEGSTLAWLHPLARGADGAPRERGPKDEEGPALGRVNLLAVPTAEVRWRGRSLGRTPIANRRLPAGEHQLRLLWADGRQRHLRVRVRPGRLTRVGDIRPR